VFRETVVVLVFPLPRGCAGVVTVILGGQGRQDGRLPGTEKHGDRGEHRSAALVPRALPVSFATFLMRSNTVPTSNGQGFRVTGVPTRCDERS
jgi:hypothetical protein